MYDIQTLKSKLKDLGVYPNKKLGQNFLINKVSCEKIVDAGLELNPNAIVEVGPGLGALTEVLIEKGKRPLLIELDRSFAQYWQEQGLRVIHQDALQLDWAELDLPKGSMLISNLPYQISSSLVIERSIHNHHVQFMVLMFQKEVAERITADKNSKNYGLLSVMAQTFWQIEKVQDVGPKDFYPPPKVASRVLKFNYVNCNMNGNQFLKFLKSAFAFRRKLLIKNLKTYNVDKVTEFFAKHSLPVKARPEDLSAVEYCQLFKYLQDQGE